MDTGTVAARITPMPGAFGASVTDVDTSRPLDATTTRRLLEALWEHHILVLSDQQLTEEQYLRFGRVWGPPLFFYNPSHRHGALPELIKIQNLASTPPEKRDGAMHWHQDSTYEDRPAFVTMLYAVEAPPTANDTMFADLAAAYDALPEGTKTRIDSLEVTHDAKGGKVHLAGEVRGKDSGSPDRPTVRHPLVVEHPIVGRKALFGISGTATGIVGWDDAAGIEQLIELKRHALQPQFRQQARAGVGSILIWDNYAVMHSATKTDYSDEDGKRRLLHRISTRGLPPLYAGDAQPPP